MKKQYMILKKTILGLKLVCVANNITELANFWNTIALEECLSYYVIEGFRFFDHADTILKIKRDSL